jgi:hypothetical protein
LQKPHHSIYDTTDALCITMQPQKLLPNRPPCWLCIIVNPAPSLYVPKNIYVYDKSEYERLHTIFEYAMLISLDVVVSIPNKKMSLLICSMNVFIVYTGCPVGFGTYTIILHVGLISHILVMSSSFCYC